jgi:hypothetical protein
MTNDEIRKAQTIAATLLPVDTAVNEAQIRDAVNRASGIVQISDDEKESLIRNLQASYTVSVGVAGTLDDNTNHVDWLAARRSEISWRAWERYRRFLQETKNFPAPIINRLDEVTDQILMRLEDPRREGSWDRRGMVVGHVQSGKTANYTGLINKAIDAGYRIVVVLTGMDDALRSQTQLRLDEGVVGFDTRNRMNADRANSRIGVGRIPGASVVNVNSLTSSDDKGDFKKAIAQTLGVNPGGKDPILLVVKKNKAILNNLISWITSFDARPDDRGNKILFNTPLLVIDDECDFASINTKANDPDVEPTAINRCVRELLRTFDQSAYIGYTATPFANIFIAPESAAEDEYGEDLFPRDFIVSLKRSSDYVGATRVFGINEDPTTGIEELEALPILRPIKDQEAWLASGHKNGFQIGPELPDSLRQAIRSFLLVCAARATRGQAKQHNSMLVHVTRFLNVQRDIAEQIEEEVLLMRQRLRYGDDSQSLLVELRSLWESDFEPTSMSFADYGVQEVSWDEIQSQLQPSMSKIKVQMVNGFSREALDYFDQEGVSIIAVGGSKLSRGLTLEGLSVSYYLRTSKMYDTLMQMGRWFGFRPGYLDLCRLYTTESLIEWYRETALAGEDLLMQFDEMAISGGTPRDFGLRVRHSSSGLLVTRAGAMKNGTKMKLTFSSDITETIKFVKDPVEIARNKNSVIRLVTDIDKLGLKVDYDSQQNGKLIWKNVGVENILNFLTEYQTHPGNYKVNNQLISEYIRMRNRDNPSELNNWTVHLVNGPTKTVALNQYKLGFIQRQDLTPGTEDFTIKRLVSPTDELIDLDTEQVIRARQRTFELFESGHLKTKDGNPPSAPSGRAIRAVRSPNDGLLLLYFIQPTTDIADHLGEPVVGMAVSFPRSARGDDSAIEYVANSVYLENELGDE